MRLCKNAFPYVTNRIHTLNSCIKAYVELGPVYVFRSRFSVECLCTIFFHLFPIYKTISMDCKQKICRMNRNQMWIVCVSVCVRVVFLSVCAYSNTPAYKWVQKGTFITHEYRRSASICVLRMYAYIRATSGATCERFIHSKAALSAFKYGSSFATLFFFLFLSFFL